MHGLIGDTTTIIIFVSLYVVTIFMVVVISINLSDGDGLSSEHRLIGDGTAGDQHRVALHNIT